MPATRRKITIRLLLAIVAGFAVGAAFVAFKGRQVRSQIIVKSLVDKNGGVVWHANVTENRDVAAPAWLLDRLGIDTFEGISQIELQDTNVADIGFLTSLSSLDNLFLDRTAVDDLTPLASLHSLRFLSLDFTNVMSLEPLRDLDNLETLSISDTNIDDLSPLYGLAKLKTLYAQRTHAREDDFDELLNALPNLVINR